MAMSSELDQNAMLPTGQRGRRIRIPRTVRPDPAKPGEVPVLDGNSPTEGCGVTSDRQRCSCRSYLRAGRETNHMAHTTTLRPLWLCVQGQLFGTHHALVYSLVTRAIFRCNQLPQGPQALGEGHGRARFRVSPIWAGRDCEIAQC